MAHDGGNRDRRGTRRLLTGAGIAGVVLFAAILAWPFVTSNMVGTPAGGANPATASDTTVGRGMPSQNAAESTVGKNNPAGQADAAGGRAAHIKESSRPLSLTEQQRQQVKSVVDQQTSPPRVSKADFEMMIGTAVPRQVHVADIPPKVTEIMNGYWGDQYVLVQDKLVIVDQHSRRIVAIVPGIG